MMSDADNYKMLKSKGFHRLASEWYSSHGSSLIDLNGWLYFKDGSKYNTENGGTINPGDIICE